MKKLLSVILSAAVLFSLNPTAFAEYTEGYEYILPPEYTKIERLQNGYIAYDNHEKCALYSLSGEKLSDDYDYIGNFYRGQLAEARDENEYFLIDPLGTVIGKFDKRIINVSDYVLVNLSEENEDGRPPSYYEGNFGIYTYTGELIGVLPYEKFKPDKNAGFWLTFTGGRLLFRENGKWGAVDSSLNTAIAPVYDKIYPFGDDGSGLAIAVKDGKYGLIDRSGGVAADFAYDAIEPLYADGRVNAYRVMQGDEYMAQQGEKYGLLDKDGKTLKPLDELVPCALYEDCRLIEVCRKNTRADSEQYGALYGFVDYSGNTVIPVENTNIWTVSDNGIISAQKAYDRCGYYDINGNEITEFKYRMVSPFSEGLAFASSCINDVWSHEVINTKGEVVFTPDNWANGFHGGIAELAPGKFIDTSGKTVIENPEWKISSGLGQLGEYDGGFIVSDGEHYGAAKYIGFVSPWARDSAAKAKELNLIYADKLYNFTAHITREEFCELIFSYLSSTSESAVSAGIIKAPFSDTDNEHIAVLNALGIICGKADGVFAPNDCLTREEAAVIVNRLICAIYPNRNTSARHFDFADSAQISDWAKSGIQIICTAGIMQGVGDNCFAPKDLYTTEQAVATLVRVYDSLAESDGTAAEHVVGEEFMLFSMPWGESKENLEKYGDFSAARVSKDDVVRYAVELDNSSFLGVNGKMLLLFSENKDGFPNLGFTTAYFSYDEGDEERLIAQGNKIYGERKSFFLDENGIENPLNPSAWYSDENMSNSMSADERTLFEKILSDHGLEKTRADAVMRGPLVVISVSESENIVTINGNKAANVFNLRNHLNDAQ